MSISSNLSRPFIVAIASLAAFGAQASGTYYNLGAGITASGSSADGSVVGAYVSGGSYYRWTAATGVQSIGGKWEGGVASVSDNGLLISGSAVGADRLVQASVYNVDTGRWKRLGGIGGSSDTSASSAWGISGDGSSVVGLGWVDAGTAHAVQSTHGGPLVDLGASGDSSRANGTNIDGSVVVGWAAQPDGFWQGTYWKNGTLTLMEAGGVALPEASAVSANGSWIIGQGGAGLETWRYNTLTGSTQFLGDFNTFNDVQGATGISADGSVIVGYDRAFGPPTLGVGTIWIEGLGMQNLTTYVTGQGVDLNGRSLALPLGVSADGRTFYGLDNTGSGFVVSLSPVPEPASWALMALGIAGLAGAAGRRRRGAAGPATCAG